MSCAALSCPIPSCSLGLGQAAKAGGERGSQKTLTAIAAKMIGVVADGWECKGHLSTPRRPHVACTPPAEQSCLREENSVLQFLVLLLSMQTFLHKPEQHVKRRKYNIFCLFVSVWTVLFQLLLSQPEDSNQCNHPYFCLSIDS